MKNLKKVIRAAALSLIMIANPQVESMAQKRECMPQKITFVHPHYGTIIARDNNGDGDYDHIILSQISRNPDLYEPYTIKYISTFGDIRWGLNDDLDLADMGEFLPRFKNKLPSCLEF
ncbi:hypothetical protein HY448_00125 [Candidatus Pacearchaeota archaeon]|nr:hypothetical protein [Candidatus Pacearchaeota archaeon]